MGRSIDTGSFVPASRVARWCGRCTRTVTKWINDRIIRGEYVRGPRDIRGRWYVTRDDADTLRAGRFPSRDEVTAWYKRRDDATRDVTSFRPV